MSTLEVLNLNDGTTTVATTFITNGSAKAWANINQVGTQAIGDSFLISSITDDAVGKSTFTFTNSMANDNFSTSLCSANNGMQGIVSQSISNVKNANLNSSIAFEDRDNSCLIIVGDLA